MCRRASHRTPEPPDAQLGESRAIARPSDTQPDGQNRGALARFRSERTHDSERLVSYAETSWRIHQAHHERAITELPASPLACTRALDVMHDTATTVSRRASSYRFQRRFRPIRERKMRPADVCKPELSKTSTRASGVYR